MTTITDLLIREIHEAWKIIPHDASWKRNLYDALKEIGGTEDELNSAFGIVKSALAQENITIPALDNRP